MCALGWSVSCTTSLVSGAAAWCAPSQAVRGPTIREQNAYVRCGGGGKLTGSLILLGQRPLLRSRMLTFWGSGVGGSELVNLMVRLLALVSAYDQMSANEAALESAVAKFEDLLQVDPLLPRFPE